MSTSLEYAVPAAAPAAASDTRGIGGHPRGLATLFFTEMWERFSYYGMKALLMLYMTASLAAGGLHLDTHNAGLIIGTYTSSVYLTPLIGGWLADHVFGTRRAVLIGGTIIACGHFSMAMHSIYNFYAGLVLIALGTGLLKPNISAMVGQLYVGNDVRRDAGFSIFYMGINLGALVAPLVCGYLGQRVNWHYGFAAAGVGMVLGLVQYVFSGDRLKGVGAPPRRQAAPVSGSVPPQRSADPLAAVLTASGAAAGLAVGWVTGHGNFVACIFPTVAGAAIGYVGGASRHLRGDELRRVLVIFILFVFSIIFWSSFEQAATSLTLFADRLTRTEVLGHPFPSSWFQSVQPTFVILLAPVFAMIWVRLGRRDPSSPTKFAFGILFAALAFALVGYASTLTGSGKVSPWWLVGCYFIQTLGELCLSPVGLSTVTRLSPARMVGLMMGVWFLSIAFGDFLAGLASGFFDQTHPEKLVSLFGSIAAVTFVAAIVLLALSPLIKRVLPRE